MAMTERPRRPTMHLAAPSGKGLTDEEIEQIADAMVAALRTDIAAAMRCRQVARRGGQ